jgi:hypothetical protein
VKIDRQAIYERDGGLCGFCGQPVLWELLHLDHITPRSLDGPTVAENLRVAHRRCNIAAGSQIRRERKRRGLPVATIGGTTTIRIPDDVLERVKQSAQQETRSVNGQIVALLKEAFAWRDSRRIDQP